LVILHRLRDWPTLLREYQSLQPSLQRDPDLMAFAARALEDSGQPWMAKDLRADSGVTDTPLSGPRQIDRLNNRVEAARQAISFIPDFEMSDQAFAWWGDQLADAVTSVVVDACMPLVELTPGLARRRKHPHEDAVTDLLVELLRQRLSALRWHVLSQGRLGPTDKDPAAGSGGRGKCDLEIKAKSAHVAVGEAIRLCGFEAKKLEEHYQRLFGYSSAGVPIIFHLMWSFAPNPAKLWKRYRSEIAENKTPAGYEFEDWHQLGKGPESSVWHDISKHRHPKASHCLVAHVLVDLGRSTRQHDRVDSRQGKIAELGRQENSLPGGHRK
jgi:hypothetical protein